MPKSEAQTAYDDGKKAEAAGIATDRCPHGGRAYTEGAYLRDCWFAGYHGEKLPSPAVKP